MGDTYYYVRKEKILIGNYVMKKHRYTLKSII